MGTQLQHASQRVLLSSIIHLLPITATSQVFHFRKCSVRKAQKGIAYVAHSRARPVSFGEVDSKACAGAAATSVPGAKMATVSGLAARPNNAPECGGMADLRGGRGGGLGISAAS